MNVLYGLETSETYPLMNFRRSTGLPGATPANHSAKQASDWEKRTLVICGRPSTTSSGLFDLAESSSRTSPVISRSASIASFGTWRDAVSAARSDCLRRRKSARPIDGNGSSSLAWPTATVGDSRNSARGTTTTGVMHVGTTLVDAVRLWPTPTTQDAHNNSGPAQHRRNVKPLNVLAGHPDPEKPRDPTNPPGRLNPDWVEMLMGFPTGWTAFEPSGMP